MKQHKGLLGRIRIWGLAVLVVAASGLGWTQETSAGALAASAPTPDSMAAAVHELQEQVRELRSVVTEMRSESAAYRAETAELRRELQETRTQLTASKAPPQSDGLYEMSPATSAAVTDSKVSANPQPASVENRIAALEESTQLLTGKVDEQYQTKVESASKYRVRLSGIVLLNLFSNRGTADKQDFPSYVPGPYPSDPNGSFGATLRQSEFGLEVFGPRLAGARTSGYFQADFAGGFPSNLNGVNSGLFRLRVASMRMDWGKTSIVAGQDSLFLAPQSPTSFASLAVPALSYAGNLWAWTPQVRVQHRFDISERQSITVQGGFLDNLTGEPSSTQYGRRPQAGERSGQPAYGARVAWSGVVADHAFTLGAASYFSRQDWAFQRHVDGWAGMADWSVALASRLSLSGEFYRGRAIGGLGGGLGRSVLFSGNQFNPASQVRGLNAIGGWSQLKFKASEKLEFNGAWGIDTSFAQDLRAFPNGQSYVDPTLASNRGSLVNFVYRPRSNLLFSSEYKRLRTLDIESNNYIAQQVNLVMGILF